MHGPKIITQNENKLEYPEHTHTHIFPPLI